MSNYKSYFLKSLGLREDSLAGGIGDETNPMSVSPEQLQMGIKVEMEHTHDPNLAKEIALDHLTEDPEYYSHLKDAGMSEELSNGQQPAQGPMMMNKLMAPKHHPSVIAIAVRGSKTGGLPSGGQFNDSEKARLGGLEKMEVLPQGGVVADPEKARLGGLERVTNLKANSQGAISDTPASDEIKASGGHYTPDNVEITGTDAPQTSCEGDDAMHPMQVQQIGNEPIENDGTTRDGETSPEAAVAGIEGGDAPETEPQGHPLSTFVAKDSDPADLSSDEENDQPEEPVEEPTNMAPEKKDEKGVWGIPMGDEDEDEDEDDKKDVSIDIKEGVENGEIGWNDLIELADGATFFTPLGRMDMWAAMGADGLSLQDHENQTPKFFKFILSHKNDIIRSAAQRGEAIKVIDDTALAKDWKRSRQENKKFKNTYPRACKSCGQTFTPEKGEGICKTCITTNECKPCGCGNSDMVNRFKTLANIPLKEAGALSEKHDQLRALVDKMKLQGKTSPAMQKAEQYLAEYDRPEASDILHGTEEVKMGELDKMIQDFVSIRNPDDTPNDIADLIVAQAQDRGIKGIEQKYDYILSQVTKYWK